MALVNPHGGGPLRPPALAGGGAAGGTPRPEKPPAPIPAKRPYQCP